MRDAHAIVMKLWHYPKPVVAAVERFAVGASAGMALLADQLVMGEDAVLSFPFQRIGLVPDWGLMVSLPWRVGGALASRLFIEAGQLAAADALAHHLAHRVVSPEAVMEEAIAAALRLGDAPLGAFGRMKRTIRNADMAKGLDAERAMQVECLMGREFAEGYAALDEKRVPDFKF